MVPTGPLTPMPKLLASDPGLFHLGPSHLVPLLLVHTGPAVPPLPKASCLPKLSSGPGPRGLLPDW